ESFGDGTDITAVPWRSNAAAITSVDVGSGVKGGARLAYMFEGCSNLTKLDLSKLETTGVTKFDRMFMNCSKLASLDVSSLDTSNATNICYMFLGCSSLTSLDVSNFDTSKTSWFHGMFSGCTSLTSLDLSRFNTAKALRTYNMFLGCSSLTSLDLSNFNTANVTDMGGTFNGCSGLTDLNISSFTTAGVENMSFMFYGCSSRTSLDVSTFDTSNVVDMTSMFNRCRSVTALNLLNFSTANVTKAQGVFFECRSLDSLDLSKMSFSNATNIDRMFSGCTNLASLDLSSFNTSNAENMTSIFNGCSSLASLDLSSFNTAKVEFSNDMFTDTPQLSTIKIGAAYALDLPQRPAKNTAGATYTGKWVAKGGTAYDYNDYPKGIADTYTAPSGYILSFDTQEGSTPPESQIVPTGSKATAVGNPTKTGHTFTGWYTEAACTNKWDFTKSVMPAKDLTLYAGWKPNAYQITYETNGGSAVAAHNADYGSKLTQPTCTKLGYTPDGWFSDVGLTTKWDFAVNTVTGDTKLYAKWKANTYTIVFDANGGTGTMADQTGVVYGAATNLNANTYTKEGHTFAGWAMSATGSVQYTDGAQVTSLVASGETTLYAKW
ncbi:MAG: BspA family leucine-rich repeat surface protein, partial [Raoultibacter sp.]